MCQLHAERRRSCGRCSSGWSTSLGERSLSVGSAFVFGAPLLCGFGLPLPENVILVAGGVLAWLASPVESVTFRAMATDPGLHVVGVGLLCILAGDSVIYWMRRRLACVDHAVDVVSHA